MKILARKNWLLIPVVLGIGGFSYLVYFGPLRSTMRKKPVEDLKK